jgi:hypothetical protein
MTPSRAHMYYKTGKLNSFSEFRIHTGGKKKEWYVGCVTARAVHVEVYAHVPRKIRK